MKLFARLACAFAVGTLITACGGNMNSETISADQLGKFWVLETLNGTAPVVEELPNLSIQATDDKSGKMAGHNACNRYFTSYTLEGNTLTMQAAGSTMMACAPEAMALEKQYMDAFNTVKNIKIDGEKLVLTSADGKNTLVFTAKEQPAQPAS